jgi:hypothetical protein
MYQAIYDTVGLELRTLSTPPYIGIPLLVLLAASALLAGASEDEKRMRNLGYLCLLFSFPVLKIGGWFITTPFIPESLFPLLGVLRESVRFYFLALLFFSVMAAFLAKRIIEQHRAAGNLVLVAIILLVMAERWPSLDRFVFEEKVPGFYAGLKNQSDDVKIFLYPNMGYCGTLKELYLQTLHGKTLSWGHVSRPPLPSNPLFVLYGGPVSASEVADYVARSDFDYIVLQKTNSEKSCFHNKSLPVDIHSTKQVLRARFGANIYEDETMLVYSTEKP